MQSFFLADENRLISVVETRQNQRWRSGGKCSQKVYGWSAFTLTNEYISKTDKCGHLQLCITGFRIFENICIECLTYFEIGARPLHLVPKSSYQKEYSFSWVEIIRQKEIIILFTEISGICWGTLSMLEHYISEKVAPHWFTLNGPSAQFHLFRCFFLLVSI